MKLSKFCLTGFLSPGVQQRVKPQAPPTGEKSFRTSHPLLDSLASRVNACKSDSTSISRQAIHLTAGSAQSRPTRLGAGARSAESNALSPEILARFQTLQRGPVPPQAELFARFEVLKHSPVQSKPESVADLYTLLQELKKTPGPTHAAAVPARRAAVPKLSVQQARAQGLATPSRPAPPIPLGGPPVELLARFEALKHPPVQSEPESVVNLHTLLQDLKKKPGPTHAAAVPARRAAVPKLSVQQARAQGLATPSRPAPPIPLRGPPVELLARFEALKHPPVQSKPESVVDLHTLLQELKKKPGPTHAAAVTARRAAVPKLSVQQARAQGLATPSRPAPPIPFGGGAAEIKQLHLQYRDAPIMFRRTNSGVAQKLSMPELFFFTSRKNNLQALHDKRASLTTNLQSLHDLIENNRSAPHDLGKLQQFIKVTRSEINNLRNSDKTVPDAATRQQILALGTQLKKANVIAQNLESIIKQAPLSLSLFNEAQALLGKVNRRIGSYK